MSGKTVNATADEQVADNANGTTVDNTAQTQEPKKARRRGVSEARGTTRLKFTHQLANPVNGLFVGNLNSVEVSNILIGESTTGMPSFNGLEIPRINLTFSSNEDDLTKRHYVSLSFNAVESTVLTIPGGKEEWKVNQIFDYIKHILNVYVFKGRPLTEDEELALSLDFEDFDEQGEYSPIDPETVIAGWRTFFENVENLLNRGKEGKSYIKTADNKAIPIWMKLIRHTKTTKKGWQNVSNGDLSFPSFVGEGVIEFWKQNVAPVTVRIDSVRETIIPMQIEKAKAPNMGAGIPTNMGGMPGGGAGFGAGDPFSQINTEASEDMPF